MANFLSVFGACLTMTLISNTVSADVKDIYHIHAIAENHKLDALRDVNGATFDYIFNAKLKRFA